MKRVLQLLMFVAIATCVTLPASAAAPRTPESSVKSSKKAQKTVTDTFHADIHCAECEKKIMRTLPYRKGVKDVNTNLRAKTIKVKYDPSKCTQFDIIKELSILDVRASLKK